MTKDYFVKAIRDPKTFTKQVIGYGVFKDEEGSERGVANYWLRDNHDNASVTLYLANKHRDDLNSGIS